LYTIGKEVAERARSAQISAAILPNYHFQFTIRIFWAVGGEVALKLNINATFHKFFVFVRPRLAGVEAPNILITQYEDAVAGFT
jgi:hypothetical protein